MFVEGEDKKTVASASSKVSSTSSSKARSKAGKHHDSKDKAERVLWV